MRTETAFINGRIWTGNSERPWASGVSTAFGRMVAAGGSEQGHSAAQVVVLGGRTVVPGFDDAHLHPVLLGKRLAALGLGCESAPTRQKLLHRVAEAAEDGMPTGLLLETAMRWFEGALKPRPVAEIGDLLSLASESVLSQGIIPVPQRRIGSGSGDGCAHHDRGRPWANTAPTAQLSRSWDRTARKLRRPSSGFPSHEGRARHGEPPHCLLPIER